MGVWSGVDKCPGAARERHHVHECRTYNAWSADVLSTILTPLTKTRRGSTGERSRLAEPATNEPLDNNRAICARDCIRQCDVSGKLLPPQPL